MTSRFWLMSLALVLVHGSAIEAQTGFLAKTHTDGAKYVVFVPHDFKADKAYPVILFLHSSGSTGDDGQKQTGNGLGNAIRKNEKAFPFIAVFPQSQKRTWKADSEDGKRALAIFDDVVKAYKTDPKRQYLTGLSMGGFGTWSMAAAHPDRWAAIAPICGGGDPTTATKFKNIPCWNFHGDADPTVKVDLSRNMIKALKDAGGAPRYSELPGVGHNAWDAAYGNPEFFTWLLEQKQK
ncbi:MAG: alpha/beta hydrolase-fold protein [Planctomycetota bacterium]